MALDLHMKNGFRAISFEYSRTLMAGTLMAHSPWLARTIIMVPTIVILCIIHPRWLELPLARTIFHGPKPVPAIEVSLYIGVLDSYFIHRYIIIKYRSSLIMD